MNTMPDWVALLWLYAFLAVAGLLAGVFVLAGRAEERMGERDVDPPASRYGSPVPVGRPNQWAGAPAAERTVPAHWCWPAWDADA